MRKLNELATYSRIIIDDPVRWMKEKSIFDMTISWSSLELHPVYRLADEQCVLVFLVDPGNAHLALDLVRTWTFQPVGQTLVRMEDGHIKTAWIATKGGATNPLPLSLDRPIPYRDLFLMEEGIGVALFTHLVLYGWDWWEPENITSMVDLWDYPFRPNGLALDEEVALLIAKAKDVLVSISKAYWEIGDIMNALGKMNVSNYRVYVLLAKTGISFSNKWMAEIAKVAYETPHPIRDYSKSWVAERSAARKLKKQRKEDTNG